MSEFKVIETQEDFDAAISARLKRDREKYAEQFEAYMREKGWKSPDEVTQLTADLTKQIETLQAASADTAKIIEQKDAEIAKGETYRADLEKTRIAIAAGLSIDQASRLRGTNTEEWTADAKKLADEFTRFAVGYNQPAPLGSAGGDTGSKETRNQFADWVNQTFQ